jgi:riboflavin kinase/FMN adenylyltransferase
MVGARSQQARVVATIGAFDGLHRGHQLLIARVRERARTESARPVLVTFDPHPDAVLRDPPLAGELTPRDEKAARLRALGISEAVVLPFDRELAQREPEDFVESQLLARFDLVGLVIGYDFRFGRRGAGDGEQLIAIGRRKGFWVESHAPVCWAEGPISSTRIRAALAEGDVESAATMLGRPYAVAGQVTSGRGLGSRELVPTANIAPPPGKLLPATGVYLVESGGDVPVRGGVAHVGPAPTVGRAEVHCIEAHLFDLRADLCGRTLEVGFLERLRGGTQFPDLDALRAAIGADIEKARNRLAVRRGAAGRPGDPQNGLANSGAEC